MTSEETRAQQERRLRALEGYAILDTPEERQFDELTQLAADICEVPVALISLIDRDRQWFKSHLGIEERETPLSNSFCARAVASHTLLMVVEDAREHPVFHDYEAVTGGGVRFYAGALLLSPKGEALGTLCVVDYQPRSLSAWQGQALQVLARQVVHQLELRRSNRLLEQEADQLQGLIDQVPVMLAQLDDQGRYLFANRDYRQWGGLEGVELKGRRPEELLPRTLLKKRQSRIRRCLKGQRIQAEEVSEDQRILDVVYLPMDIPEGQGVLIVGRDITESRRAEAIKNEFVSTVSHELRTPLTSIIGALGLATGGALGELPDKARGMLELAHGNSQRLKHLINDLLDMDKLVAGKMHFDMTAQSLAPLISQSMKEMALFNQEYGVDLQWQAPDKPVRARVDGYRFQQILTNLISNAIKFSPKGAPVLVELTQQDGWARISVRDQGPGIDQKAQSQLFQRFYQVDASSTREKGGTGLGLAISRELAERMNGQLWVESVPGEGSCFILALPLMGNGSGSKDTGKRHQTAREKEGNRLLALHVEDDQDLQRVLAMMAREVADFDGVTSLSQARQALSEHYYDLVLLDLDLPDGCGWSLLEDIQRIKPAPAVVVLSGMEAEVPDRFHVDAVLTKSRMSDEELHNTLSGFLNH
ncbi:MAG: ATP-binding protein [Oleiphilaceae bacterium]|nr:ATP-binding protein [Oleiphilaceae bacterium]